MLQAHWPLIAAIGGPILLTVIATLISVYQDPDNDPATPPPGWVQVLIVCQKLLTWRAPEGTTGIAGTKMSIPLLHYPKKDEAMSLPPLNPTALIPFLLIGALGACATPGGQAFTKCELGALPQSSETVIACAVGALSSPADWEGQLTACGISLLPAQFKCVIAAIVGALESNPKLQIGSTRSLVLSRGQMWLKLHGKGAGACNVQVHL